MKRVASALLALLLLIAPTHLFAKAETTRITISGSNLKAPIQISDPDVVKKFQVWGKSLIIDESAGRVAQPPQGFERYEVRFYAKFPEERLVYVVFYEYDFSTHRGYVYLPGKNDPSYWLNMRSIVRGGEGYWFRAWDEWDTVATPLIARAAMSTSANE